MKKRVFIVAAATAFSAFVTETQAHAYLRSLENKARSKVIEKIEKNAGKSKETGKSAASNQTSKSGTDVQTTQGVYSGDPFMVHVDNLTAPETCQYLSTDFNDIKVINKDVKFLTFADAIKALPELPTAEQIIRLDVAPVQAMNDFNKGCDYYYTRVTDNYTNATQKAKNQIAAKRSKAGSPQMNNANAMQVLQLMQKHGIDPQKASDKEMEAFVMKMIASGELQLQGGGGVVDVNYSDAQEAAIDKIENKIDELNNKLTAFYEKYNSEVYNFGKERKLRALYTEQQKAWRNSDAYKQVYNIEKDIDNRSLAYIKNNPTCVYYPDFWVAGRKQENEAITKFNLANAEKWRAILQEVADDQKPLLNEFTAIETELEAAFSNKEDMTYATLKQNLSIAFSQWSKFYGIVYSKSYGLPLVRHVSEDNTIGQ